MNRAIVMGGVLPSASPAWRLGAWLLLSRAERRQLSLAMNWVASVGDRTRVAFKKSGGAFRDETERLQAEVVALAENDPSAFGVMVRRLGIPRRRLASMVDGWNLYFVRGVSRDARQLDAFLRQWAGAPMVLRVEALSGGKPLSVETVRALQALGMAEGLLRLLLQLEEELQDARYVFPLDELDRFQVSREDLAARRRPPGFHDLCWFQLKRAREWIAQARPALSELPTNGARRMARLSALWCEDVASRIEKGGYPLMGEARKSARLEPGWWETMRMILKK